MTNLWGDLTGVKPVKLTRELFKGNPFNGRQPHERAEVYRILTEERGLSKEKAELLIEIYEYQNPTFLTGRVCNTYCHSVYSGA